MDPFRLAEISAAGLLAQKARVEAAAANLAHLHASSADPAARYRPVAAVIHAASSGFGSAWQAAGRPVVRWVPSDAPPRRAYEPGHPHADADGIVSYPGVDPTHEMLTVMGALRAYEANLAALQATRALAVRALDIGGRA
jgi:flagellar basal-body rod protein FlgC